MRPTALVMLSYITCSRKDIAIPRPYSAIMQWCMGYMLMCRASSRMQGVLQVDATGHVRLQLATSLLKDPADDMEVLRAELDHMEHGGEDADEAHMYALPVLASSVLI